jgi:hypothetical protein
MGEKKNGNANQAWADFAATGSVQAYLRYRQATENTQTNNGEITNLAAADTGARPAPNQRRRKRPNDNGAF